MPVGKENRRQKTVLSPAALVRDLAHLAASMDPEASRSRLAVVASGDVAFGLGRMFQTFRELDPHSRKEVSVFRTMDEARAFLGIKQPLTAPDVR